MSSRLRVGRKNKSKTGFRSMDGTPLRTPQKEQNERVLDERTRVRSDIQNLQPLTDERTETKPHTPNPHTPERPVEVNKNRITGSVWSHAISSLLGMGVGWNMTTLFHESMHALPYVLFGKDVTITSNIHPLNLSLMIDVLPRVSRVMIGIDKGITYAEGMTRSVHHLLPSIDVLEPLLPHLVVLPFLKGTLSMFRYMDRHAKGVERMTPLRTFFHMGVTTFSLTYLMVSLKYLGRYLTHPYQVTHPMNDFVCFVNRVTSNYHVSEQTAIGLLLGIWTIGNLLSFRLVDYLMEKKDMIKKYIRKMVRGLLEHVDELY